jgi:pantetheine-phosphate adenylyltransferase
MPVAVYPGSFDPVHFGHLDIAARATVLFDRLVVGVYDRPSKDLLFTLDERVDLMRLALAGLSNVIVVPYTGLTVSFARKHEAQVIIRGLRVPHDFEYEYQMALTNRKLDPAVDTLCLMTSLDYAFLSSTIVKDIARAGGNVSCMVPGHVADALRQRLSQQAALTVGVEGG